MAARVLSELQREVLAWVADGCPAGVYEGFSHRISARTLAGKGLIKIKGRGTAWQAVVTEAGQRYLETAPGDTGASSTPGNTRPSRSSTRAGKAGDRSREGDAPAASVRTPDDTAAGAPVVAPRKPPARMGPVDQMMTALRENGDRGLVVGDDEATRYRQLAASAKRHGRIPDGMQIVIKPVRGERVVRVALVPLPAWQTAVLTPLTVPARLNNPSDVAHALGSSETFTVAGEARGRALRLIEALVTTGREHGMRVKLATGVQPTDGRGYTSNGPRRDEVRFTIDADTFALWVTQGELEVPHTPTARELKRAARGHAFADRDTIPDPHLGIHLHGDGGVFWASSWSDTDEHRLDDDLAQILEEMRLRHGRLVEQRYEQDRRNEQRRGEWEKARDRAVVSYARAYRVSAMNKQAQRWRDAELLRDYAAAISDGSQTLDKDAREQAVSWAKQILAQADSIDPLTKPIGAPDVPPPSAQDLGPFTKPHSPYGP